MFAHAYLIWVISAFFTFQSQATPRNDRRRRRHRARSERRPAASGGTPCRPRTRRIAVAPPLIGRARIRRRRIVAGTRRALILGGRGPSLGDHAEEGPRRDDKRDEQGAPAGSCRWHDADCIRRPVAVSLRALANGGLSMAEACRALLGSLRVGQASNPGPPRPLEWISTLAASAVSYAAPGKLGFHGVMTPGLVQDDAGPPVEPFTLSVVTANTTGWRPLQRLLDRTKAGVVFAQEHRLLPEDVPAASAWARKRGWKTIWAPATVGPGGGASGGTVVCARAFMGLRHPDKGGAIVAEGRVAAAIIEPPACRPFVGYAAYFYDGQGLSRANLGLAAAIGAHWEAMEDSTLQLVLAADFNMEPAAFARACLADKVWGRLVVPPTPRGTCRTRARASTFDYFFMSAPMADLVANVTTWEDSGTRTHVPAIATFHPRLVSLKALALRTPPALPVDAVFGPRPPPPDWSGIQRASERLVNLIKDGCPYDDAEEVLTNIYGAWLNTAEEELADITGTRLPRMGRRAEGPRMMWRSILPEVSRRPQPTGAAALAWLADIARDATRIARPPRDDDDVPRHELVAILLNALGDTVDGRQYLDDDGTTEQLRAILAQAHILAGKGDHVETTDWDDWAKGLEAFLEITRARQAACGAAEAAAAISDWKEWVRKGIEAGAKNAHAYLRLPAEWKPTSATTSIGTRTARPADLLGAQRDKYAAAWNADADCGRYQWPDREALPRLGPSDLRTASGLFKKSTATAYDGIHCRHYALLCDDSLTALGTILEACERLGNFPKQARLVVTPLLEKPKGGFRPVAVYVSLYRLWAKARRNVAADWEASHLRPFFSSAKGNGPLDTAWRQGVRQEAGISRGGASACLLWDLESFYECIDRERLLRRAHETNFPMPVIRLSMAMYAVPRVLSMEGRISKEVWPKRGVGAGCGLANTYVKIYTLPPMDRITPALPDTANVDLHIDDFLIEVVADSEEKAFRDLVEAHRIVKDMIERELGAVVSVPKAALVASSRGLAARLRGAIGTLAGPVIQAAPNLGIDAAAAKRRAALGTGPLRKMRWANAQKKRRRLRRLAGVVGPRAAKVFTVGVQASAVYHAAVQGLTDQEVLKLRRLAAVVYPPRSRFRSLTMTHILQDMPTAMAEVAAALHYSRAVWSAALLGSARPRYPGFDLPGLRESWEQVAASSGDFIHDDHPDPAKRRKWGGTRGPISSAILELHRAGWKALHPFEWENDQGVRVVLTSTPPALLRTMLKESIRRQAERAMGDKWAATHPSFTGRRLCMDAAIDALHRSRSLNPQQKGAFRATLLGGVLTKSKAAERGYDVDDLCDLCGERGDGIFHRTYLCTGTRDAVKGAVPAWFWAEAQRADPHDPFWTLAVVPHPADLVPMPKDDYLSWVVDGHGERCSDPGMSGHVFIDGSCSTAVFRGLERAALAIVQLADDATPVKTVSVPIWATLPQTSQSAEHAAYAGVSHVLEDDATVYGDCKAVVDMACLPPERRFDGRRKYAGVHLSMRKFPTGLAHITKVTKVKAHQCIDGIKDDNERWRAIGNDLADKAAKAAVLRHPRPSAELAAQIAFWEKRAPHVVRAVATAMPLFPPLAGKLTRSRTSATRDLAGARASAAPRHQWEHTAGRWRCGVCWTYIAGQGTVPESRRNEPCQANRVSLRQQEFQRRGHIMLNTDGELPITFCARCGGWSSRRANRLSRECGPPTAAGRMALRRIADGLHPWRARDAAAGGELRRTRIAVKPVHKSAATPAGGPTEEAGKRPRQHGPPAEPADKKRRTVDRTDTADGDAMDTLDLVVADDVQDDMGYLSEEDVFHHGGGFDQPQCEAENQQGGPLPTGAAGPHGDACAADARPAAAYAAQAQERLAGVSMAMLISTLRHTPARHGREHMVPTFDAVKGTIVRAALGDIQEEVERRRARGIRDDEQAAVAGDTAAAAADPRAQHMACGATGNGPPVSASGNHASNMTRFTDRAELIRHLAKRPEGIARGPHEPTPIISHSPSTHGEPSQGMKRKAVDSTEFDDAIAVASSTKYSAVGAREGPGGPLHEAGAAAAAASHQSGVAAAAVTADCMAAALPSNIAALDPPNGFAAPLDGKEHTKGTRPLCTAPRRWPKRPVAGTGWPSLYSLRKRPKRPVAGAGNRHARSDEDGQCQPGDERRRVGADEPPSWRPVARRGPDATGPGGGKGPSEGSAQGVLGARNECDPRQRPGEDVITDKLGTAHDGADRPDAHATTDGCSSAESPGLGGAVARRPTSVGMQHCAVDRPLPSCAFTSGVPLGDEVRPQAPRQALVHPRGLQGLHRTVHQRVHLPPPRAPPQPARLRPSGDHLGHRGGPPLQDRGDHGADIRAARPRARETIDGHRPAAPPGTAGAHAERPPGGEAWHLAVNQPPSPCGIGTGATLGVIDHPQPLRRLLVHPWELRGSHRPIHPRARLPPPVAPLRPLPPHPRGDHPVHRGEPLSQAGGVQGADLESDVTAERRREGTHRPLAHTRRRVTGKRKDTQAGDTLPAQLGGPASRPRCDSGIVHDLREHHPGVHLVNSLPHGAEGPDMSQAELTNVSAHQSTHRGSGGHGAWRGDAAPSEPGNVLTIGAINGELNTLKSTTTPSAALPAGDLPSHALDAAASSHALREVT